MKENGFVRVGALVNKLSLGNVIENAKEISRQIKKLMRQELKSLLLPNFLLLATLVGICFYKTN